MLPVGQGETKIPPIRWIEQYDYIIEISILCVCQALPYHISLVYNITSKLCIPFFLFQLSVSILPYVCVFQEIHKDDKMAVFIKLSTLEFPNGEILCLDAMFILLKCTLCDRYCLGSIKQRIASKGLYKMHFKHLVWSVEQFVAGLYWIDTFKSLPLSPFCAIPQHQALKHAYFFHSLVNSFLINNPCSRLGSCKLQWFTFTDFSGTSRQEAIFFTNI